MSLLAPILLLAACGAPDAEPGARPDRTTPTPSPFALEGDALVALPYAVAGDTMGTATLTVANAGETASEGDLALDVPDPFDVSGELGPLAPGETRTLTVAFAGSAAEAAIYTGEIGVRADGQELTVRVAAVVGDAALPDARWTPEAEGERTTLALPSAPFPYGDAPYDDASVLIFVPESLTDGDGVGVVAHLHGHNATLEEVVADQRLVEQHALSGRDAILLVPQGPVEAADSDFGRLDEPDGFATLVRDALAVLYRDGKVTWPEVGATVVTAHSGGYAAAANIVEHGGVDVGAVHLFDALYGREDTFRAFAGDGGVLRSVYTAYGGTTSQNVALAAHLAQDGVAVGTSFADVDLDADAVTVGDSSASHMECVAEERAYARWLTSSGLGVRPAAPPELRATISDGERTVVTWREDPGGQALAYRVEGSDDGVDWTLLAEASGARAEVEARPWIRVLRTEASWGDSDPSDVYGGTGADWLVVDGFDRVLDGSWTEATHPFAAWVGGATGAGFSTASNEAVAAGDVDLLDFPHTIWLLGDEGTADVTFDAAERAAIEAYLAAGGKLVVSGAEVGYATDGAWLASALGVAYVADDAGTDVVEGMTLGEAYPEDYPDVLDGDEVVWTYATGGGAAVLSRGRVLVVGFGLENLPADRRAAAIASLVARLE